MAGSQLRITPEWIAPPFPRLRFEDGGASACVSEGRVSSGHHPHRRGRRQGSPAANDPLGRQPARPLGLRRPRAHRIGTGASVPPLPSRSGPRSDVVAPASWIGRTVNDWPILRIVHHTPWIGTPIAGEPSDMDVVFGLWADGGASPDHGGGGGGSLGQPVVGPTALIDILETALGLGGPRRPQVVRIADRPPRGGPRVKLVHGGPLRHE